MIHLGVFHISRWVQRRARGLPLLLLLCLGAVLGACGPAAVAAGPFPRFAEFANREIAEVHFAGDLQLPVDSLRAVIVTRPTRCHLLFLPICIPGTRIGLQEHRLDLVELARDVARLQLYYRDHGYYATRVVPTVDPLPRERVAVRFAIVPGDQVILRALEIEGAEEILPTERLLRQIPLRVDEPFRRAAFLASADTIRAELLRRGYANAGVLRNFEIDTVADFAGVVYQVIPGPLVRVDSVLIVGANRLQERIVRRMLTFREDDLLRLAELNSSQRNLYGLGMVNFASVEVAPDTLQLNAEEDATSTVLVRVVEAPQYLVDATAGYGTVDCFRLGASWTNRNFLGGARRLDVSGNVSKLGVGWPADAGLEQNLCRALVLDEFSDTLNYRIGADFQQPRLFGTQNRLGVGVRALRMSELDAYVRRAVGGQVAVSRELGPATLLATTADIERGATRARAAVFCVAFDVCTQPVREELQRPRWSNAVAANLIHDRTATEGVATRGWAARSGVAWATPAFGSDDEFLRVNAEVVGSTVVRPGWVLAGRLQGGTFLQGGFDPGGAFIPPERRFYAGGPNSVRGYGRNALGPVVYVAQPGEYVPRPAQGDTVLAEGVRPRAPATGGTESVVGSVELRTPSPVLSDFVRLGFFVDGGQLWAPGTNLAIAPLRFTPGFGVRFITPVGPIRVDAAYNPYGLERGPIYVVDDEGNLILWRTFPEPQDDVGRRLWDRFQIHFAVGNAF
jgi:outer membrane protein insertion porin family